MPIDYIKDDFERDSIKDDIYLQEHQIETEQAFACMSPAEIEALGLDVEEIIYF